MTNDEARMTKNPFVTRHSSFVIATPMPQHPLQHRIAALRSRAGWLMTIRGVSVVAAAVLATLIALGSLDYAIRFQDRGVLAIFSVAVLGVLVWTAYRYLLVPRAVRLGDCDLAMHVEARFPAAKDRLASALEFLKQSEHDATAGSAALRRAVIAQTAAETDGLDFTQVLDRRPTIRAATTAMILGLCAAGLVLLNPAAARIALARLAAPPPAGSTRRFPTETWAFLQFFQLRG